MSAADPVRLATRASPLARWQAEATAEAISAAHPEVGSVLVEVSTEGDRRTDVPLEVIGGKGVFVKEVQAALLDGRADVAVHSAKDLPAAGPDGLVIAALLPRGDPRDALAGSRMIDLPTGAKVGTGSARRKAQLLDLRPDLDVVGLRGNIATRLGRVGELDAIVVAAAALERLGIEDRAAELLSPAMFCPQVGQGAVAVECRSDDAATLAVLADLDDRPTRVCVEAERSFLAELGGDCYMPAGAYATLDGSTLSIIGVLDVGGTRPARAKLTGDASGDGPIELGLELARKLLATGRS
ncbi:MAG: hydroxymethylbilane synthase [Candidatus Microthrix sp.]|nr:hydroxymethylbilane synthase [Candidatus Microthrix sp.]